MDIILCLEQECQSDLKYTQDYKQFLQIGGKHYAHKNSLLIDLKLKFNKEYINSFEQMNLNKLVNNVDRKSAEIKEAFSVIMDQQANVLKKSIQSNTNDQCVQLYLAIISQDIELINRYSNIFYKLNDPDIIVNDYSKNYTKVSHKINACYNKIISMLSQFKVFNELNDNNTDDTNSLTKRVILTQQIEKNEKVNQQQNQSFSPDSQYHRLEKELQSKQSKKIISTPHQVTEIQLLPISIRKEKQQQVYLVTSPSDQSPILIESSNRRLQYPHLSQRQKTQPQIIQLQQSQPQINHKQQNNVQNIFQENSTNLNELTQQPQPKVNLSSLNPIEQDLKKYQSRIKKTSSNQNANSTNQQINERQKNQPNQEEIKPFDKQQYIQNLITLDQDRKRAASFEPQFLKSQSPKILKENLQIFQQQKKQLEIISQGSTQVTSRNNPLQVVDFIARQKSISLIQEQARRQTSNHVSLILEQQLSQQQQQSSNYQQYQSQQSQQYSSQQQSKQLNPPSLEMNLYKKISNSSENGPQLMKDRQIQLTNFNPIRQIHNQPKSNEMSPKQFEPQLQQKYYQQQFTRTTLQSVPQQNPLKTGQQSQQQHDSVNIKEYQTSQQQQQKSHLLSSQEVTVIQKYYVQQPSNSQQFRTNSPQRQTSLSARIFEPQKNKTYTDFQGQQTNKSIQQQIEPRSLSSQQRYYKHSSTHQSQ